MSAAPRRSLCCAMTRCRAASPTRARPYASWRTTLRIRTFSAYAISSSACRWRRDGGQALMPVLPSGHGFGTVTSQESSSTEATKCFTARTTFWIGLACHGESSPRGAAIAGIERETSSRVTTEIFFINPPCFSLEGRPSTLRSDREHCAPTRNSLQSRAFREQAGCAAIMPRTAGRPRHAEIKAGHSQSTFHTTRSTLFRRSCARDPARALSRVCEACPDYLPPSAAGPLAALRERAGQGRGTERRVPRVRGFLTR